MFDKYGPYILNACGCKVLRGGERVPWGVAGVPPTSRQKSDRIPGSHWMDVGLGICIVAGMGKCTIANCCN